MVGSRQAREEKRYGTIKKYKGGLHNQGVSYLGLTSYGSIMVGDRAFEFYNERNVKDHIQIPWEEVDRVVASVLFKGRRISRFAIMTKSSGTLSFSSRNNKALLRAVRVYVEEERIVRSLSFFDVMKRNVTHIFRKKKGDHASC